MSVAIIGVALLFFLGHALKWFFVQTKIPDLLILVGLGYFIGPVLGIVQAHDLGKVGPFLTTVALIVILYEGGISLRAKDLLSSSLPALGMSIVGFLLISTVATLLAWLTGQTMVTALLFGVGIGSTSSAIVIPMVKFLSVSDKTKTILSLESAFTDVLAIVIFLVLVDGATQGTFSAKKLLVGIGPDTLKAILMGLASGLIWSLSKARFKFLTGIKFSGEAWAMLTYGILEEIGLNGAMGVLALGFTLANLDLLPEYAKSVFSTKPVSRVDMALLGEITFLLKTAFFIYLGMLVKFSDWKIVLFAFVSAILIFATRYLSVLFVMNKAKYDKVDAMITTAMGPRGLACAVLATVPIQKGLQGGAWIQDTMFALIPMTIVLTAVLVVLSENENFRTIFTKFFSKYLDLSQKSEHSEEQIP